MGGNNMGGNNMGRDNMGRDNMGCMVVVYGHEKCRKLVIFWVILK